MLSFARLRGTAGQVEGSEIHGGSLSELVAQKCPKLKIGRAVRECWEDVLRILSLLLLRHS